MVSSPPVLLLLLICVRVGKENERWSLCVRVSEKRDGEGAGEGETETERMHSEGDRENVGAVRMRTCVGAIKLLWRT